MKEFIPLLIIILSMIVSACTVQTPTEQPPYETPEPTTPTTAVPTVPLTTLQTAEVIIQAIAEKDMTSVANFVHPGRGLRFSPYATIRDDHLVFKPADLTGLFDSEEVLIWGNYDGSGDPITLTFAEYYDEFVYTADFANPETVALNMRIGQGNTLNNIQDFYPDSDFVEYHFSGFEEQYDGMDWQSLRLVFVEEDGVPYLVAIVHDQWTI